MTMRVICRHTLDDLERDMRKLPVKAERLFATTTRKNAQAGNRLAKRNATESSGTHGHLYPDRFNAEMITPTEWVYGPSGHPQGEMAFEGGGHRWQEPHHDLANSADVIGPKYARDISADLGKLFW